MKDVVWGRLSLPGRAVWVPGHGTDRWVRSRCRTRARVGVTEACGRERGVSTDCATVPGPREHGEGARGHAGKPPGQEAARHARVPGVRAPPGGARGGRRACAALVE